MVASDIPEESDSPRVYNVEGTAFNQEPRRVRLSPTTTVFAPRPTMRSPMLSLFIPLFSAPPAPRSLDIVHGDGDLLRLEVIWSGSARTAGIG